MAWAKPLAEPTLAIRRRRTDPGGIGRWPVVNASTADPIPAGGTEQVLGCTVKAPSTLGTFVRGFRWGHVRQLDRVSRELLAQAWAGGGLGGER